VTGTSVSIVPRRVQTQQVVQLSMTGMETGAQRNVTITINPPTGNGTLNFKKIEPQTNNTTLNEMYVFTLADDSYAFLHVGDYQEHLDSTMPTTVDVAFSSVSATEEGGRERALGNPVEDVDWGRMLTFRNQDREITPFSRMRGNTSQETLSTVPPLNNYLISISPRLLTTQDGSRPFLCLKEIVTAGPIRIITPEGAGQSIRRPSSRIEYVLRVQGPGTVKAIFQINPRHQIEPPGRPGRPGPPDLPERPDRTEEQSESRSAADRREQTETYTIPDPADTRETRNEERNTSNERERSSGRR